MLSIIIPAYNAEKTIRKCLDSLQSQNYKNFEALIVDDGSTDGTKTICDLYAAQDSRFKVFHRANSGVSASRNFALDCVAGEYIMFLDSDDYIEVDMCQKMLSAITEQEKAGVAICGVFIEENGKISKYPQRIKEETFDNSQMLKYLLLGKQVKGWLCNKIFSREIIGDERLNTSLKFLEDLEFLLRIAQKNDYLCKYVPYYGYHYIITQSSAGHDSEKRIESLDVFNKCIDGIPNSVEKTYRIVHNTLTKLRLSTICHGGV